MHVVYRQTTEVLGPNMAFPTTRAVHIYCGSEDHATLLKVVDFCKSTYAQQDGKLVTEKLNLMHKEWEQYYGLKWWKRLFTPSAPYKEAYHRASAAQRALDQKLQMLAELGKALSATTFTPSLFLFEDASRLIQPLVRQYNHHCMENEQNETRSLHAD